MPLVSVLTTVTGPYFQIKALFLFQLRPFWEVLSPDSEGEIVNLKLPLFHHDGEKV